MKARIGLLFAFALLLASCSDEPGSVSPVSTDQGQQPTFGKVSTTGIDLTNRYIVVFKKTVGNPEALTNEMSRGNGVQVHYRYSHALKGFAATIPEQALEGLRRNPNVDYIEADGIATKVGSQSNPPSWGLDRVDQRNRPLDQVYNYQNDGSGVKVYIIDTGIRNDHQEYVGRVLWGWDFIDNDAVPYDCDGHGTHVAGTVGGANVGIAKGVTLVAVRVLDCNGSGTWSQVIAGIDWVTGDHQSGQPAVANMSLGGGASTSVDQAVTNSINDGVVYCVAAGNNNRNAANYSPARVPAAITVAASTSTDARASYSNYGSVVDIFAPGSGIYSSTMTSTNTYETWSGTSMATPHVAGVAALYLSANPTATVAQVTNAITSNATSGVLSSIGTGSPNLLLYSLIAAAPGPQPPDAPTGLSASAALDAVTLSWTDNATNEDEYFVEYATSATGSYTQLAQLGPNATSYVHSGLGQGVSYWYRVRAHNTVGYSAYSNVATATTLQQVHVAALSISSALISKGWTGTLTVTVHNAANQPQAGVTVSVTYGSTTKTGVTGSNGQVAITTNKLKTNVASVTMTVTNLSGAGFVYDNTANYCYPNLPALTVSKP
jgi:subtilisin family serine protease